MVSGISGFLTPCKLKFLGVFRDEKRQSIMDWQYMFVAFMEQLQHIFPHFVKLIKS